MKRLILLLTCIGPIGTNLACAQTAQPAPLKDCATIADQGIGSCDRKAAIFSTPLRKDGLGHRLLTDESLVTYGPSVNFGNSGGWTVTQVIGAPHVVFGTSGIDQFLGANIVKNGTGDLAGAYLYVFGGGRAAQSDEGVTGLTVESGEIDGYFHGTISGPAGRGATSLTLAYDPKAPHNWHATCDGCMLLDIGKGDIAGSLDGKSARWGSTYLQELPTANVTVHGKRSGLPVTHAWCKALSAIPATTTAGLGTSRTLDCTLGAIGDRTPAFTAGGVVTIAGEGYPEQASLVAVGDPSHGVQSLTLLARNPNPAGAIIFQGGIAGQSLSFDDNLSYTGFRTSYYVFGSVDGKGLIYGSQIAGTIDGAHQTLPRRGAEAETDTSGFHLYPSAEIVANTAQPSAPILEPNNVDWEPGDVVENPRFQSFGGRGILDVCKEFTPSDESVASTCIQIAMEGSGVAGTYQPFRMANYNPPTLYYGGGGKLSPVPAIVLGGPFGDILAIHDGPSQSYNGTGTVIRIGNTFAHDNTPFNLFDLPNAHGGGATQVTYDPGTRIVGFPQGLTAASIGTSQNCSSAAAPANCGQASAGSIAMPYGANSLVVITSAVTAKSQILITPDASLNAQLGVTCNTNPVTAFAPFGIVARVPGRSFTVAIAGNAGSNPNCYSFQIVN
jgi:hypothetical protein